MNAEKKSNKYWPSRPQWDRAWDHITLKQNYGFFDGGCLILAEALRLVYSGSRVGTILVDGRADHYVICLPGGWWADADGPVSCSRDLVKRYCLREIVRAPAHAVDKKIFHPQIPRSSRISKELAKILTSPF